MRIDVATTDGMRLDAMAYAVVGTTVDRRPSPASIVSVEGRPHAAMDDGPSRSSVPARPGFTIVLRRGNSLQSLQEVDGIFGFRRRAFA